MKKINLFLCISAIVATTFLSCSEDNSSETESEIETENIIDSINTSEETIIPVTTLNSGISIENASKETGTPPVPNSDLNFDLNTNLTEAFQSTGLKIEFSSTDAITGAYILFKDLDGNTSDDYFDVPSSAFETSYSNKKTTSRERVISSSKIAPTLESVEIVEEVKNEIEINFDATIPAGQFCYDICLYDASNNVSQIQTVCVTVEAWGGNSTIVGEWVINREQSGQINDDIAKIICNNFDTITANYSKVIKDEYTLVLNEDGTYSEVYDQEEKDLDYNASQESCTAIYNTELERDYEQYSGNWAYNKEDETLTTVDFKYEDFINPEYNEEYQNGSIYFEGVTAKIVSGQLVLSGIDGNETNYYDRK